MTREAEASEVLAEPRGTLKGPRDRATSKGLYLLGPGMKLRADAPARQRFVFYRKGKVLSKTILVSRELRYFWMEGEELLSVGKGRSEIPASTAGRIVAKGEGSPGVYASWSISHGKFYGSHSEGIGFQSFRGAGETPQESEEWTDPSALSSSLSEASGRAAELPRKEEIEKLKTANTELSLKVELLKAEMRKNVPYLQLYRFGAGAFSLSILSLLTWSFTGEAIPFHPLFVLAALPAGVVFMAMAWMTRKAERSPTEL